MYIYGKWLLEETSGTTLSDTSGNSNDGVTDGTPSGTDGVLLTESQTITLPIELSSETSIGVFFFIKTSIPQKEQMLLSNSSGNTTTSLTIGLDMSGLVYVDHGGNRLVSELPIDTNETHIGYIFDDRYYSQQLFINGALVSTQSFANAISNNSNNFTAGELFSGNMRDMYIYSGEVSSSVPEGLSKGYDIELILPSGTVYASSVQTSGDVITHGVLYRDEYLVSSEVSSKKNHFVYDDSTGETIHTSSIKHGNNGTIGIMVKDSSIMSTPVSVTHNTLQIGINNKLSVLNTTGLRFNTDEAGIYFGENQEFRIVMTTDTPSRLTFQNYDTSTQEYVTKYSVANK